MRLQIAGDRSTGFAIRDEAVATAEAFRAKDVAGLVVEIARRAVADDPEAALPAPVPADSPAITAICAVYGAGDFEDAVYCALRVTAARIAWMRGEIARFAAVRAVDPEATSVSKCDYFAEWYAFGEYARDPYSDDDAETDDGLCVETEAAGDAARFATLNEAAIECDEADVLGRSFREAGDGWVTLASDLFPAYGNFRTECNDLETRLGYGDDAPAVLGFSAVPKHGDGRVETCDVTLAVIAEWERALAAVAR